MSAQSLLSSVFSCSSPAAAAPAAAKSLSKRRLRQTRSLDPAIIGGCREDSEGAGRVPRVRAAGSPPGERCNPRGAPPVPGASFSTPSTPLERSPPGSVLFDEENPRGKRSPGCELPFLARTPSASALSGPANSIFSSPRRWLQQRKGQPSLPGPPPAAYVVWKSELDQWREAALYVPIDGRDDQYPQSADFAYKKHLDEQVRSAKFNPTHVSVP